MQDFRRIKVWERAHSLTLRVYRATRTFPGKEIHGLSRQLRTAAASVPANIAEGCGRSGKRGDIDFRRFLIIAMGSASELEYHLMLARDLNYLDVSEHQRLEALVFEVKKMLAAFIRRLES